MIQSNIEELRTNINGWITALQEKLKMDGQLEDRIKALTELEKAVQQKKLGAPFDELPKRGLLDIRKFIEDIRQMSGVAEEYV